MSKSWSSYRASLLSLLGSSLLVLAACGQNGPAPGTGGGDDGGGSNSGICSTNKDCTGGMVCSGGVCTQPTSCQRDTDCNPGQTCNVLTGKCENGTATDGGSGGGTDGGVTDGGTPDGGATDGGTADAGTPICTPGTVQCTSDATGIQTCSTDGMQWNTTTCDASTPVCVNASCLLCAPGSTQCNGNVAETCAQDGASWNDTDCAATGGTCNGGLCQVCTPGAVQCKDQTTSETCNSTGTAWTDTACSNGICDSTNGQCKATTCVPGSPNTCQGDKVVSCKSDGSGYTTVTDCAAQGGTCQGGQCVSLCDQAAANNSYIGCEYWPVALSNPVSKKFQTEYGLVVSNPNAGTTAIVKVYKSGSTTPVVTQSVVGGAVQNIKLPWNAMNADPGDGNGNQASATTKGAIAYKMTSSVPVTVYQFNPLSSAKPSGCTSDTDCLLQSGSASDTCDTTTGTCSLSDYAYSMDASLLLPAHIYGQTNPPSGSPASTYVAATLPHSHVHTDCGGSSAQEADLPSIVAIVASSPGTTTVHVHAQGAIAAGGPVSQIVQPGSDVTFTLNQYDVLQLASAPAGTATVDSQSQPLACGFFQTLNTKYSEYPDSDLTGSIITADHPIAVYGGADCRFVPYNKYACDHMEQQLFPFQNWGDKYIGAVSQPTGQSNVGDLWEVVAAVSGTKVSFDPPISGISNPTTLNAGEKIRFPTNNNFVVSSQDLQHPILVTQFFQGEEAHSAQVGDPTMILAVPVEQYRTDYAFSTPTTVAQDYMNVIRPTGAAVTLDGQPVSPASGWTTVGSSGFQVGRVSITDGTHHLSAAQPVGLTVYGYDSYVSYGYPGGLDLKQTVIIVPGG